MSSSQPEKTSDVTFLFCQKNNPPFTLRCDLRHTFWLKRCKDSPGQNLLFVCFSLLPNLKELAARRFFFFFFSVVTFFFQPKKGKGENQKTGTSKIDSPKNQHIQSIGCCEQKARSGFFLQPQMLFCRCNRVSSFLECIHEIHIDSLDMNKNYI